MPRQYTSVSLPFLPFLQVELICDECGVAFLRRRSDVKSALSYCSMRCSGAAQRKRVPRRCLHCGGGFEVRPSELRERAASYCSRRCQYAGKRRPVPERFWNLVPRRDGCWVWTGSILTTGYGCFTWRGNGNGRSWVATHRLAWELTYGDIPDGLLVLHRCDNPPCVRPDHLFLGTPADNTADMYAKGRASRRSGETNGGSKLTDVMVREIRRLRAETGILQHVIAKQYGVSRSTIGRILRNVAWRHV